MQNFSLRSYLTIPEERYDLTEENQGLYRRLAAIFEYVPLLLGFNGAGYIILYALSFIGALDAPDIRLVALAGIFFLTALLYLISYPLIKNANLSGGSLIFIVANSLLVFSQAFFWDGLLWLLVSFGLIPALETLPQRAIRTWVKVVSVIASLTTVVGVITINATIQIDRIQTTNLSTMAALSIYLLVSVMALLLVNISSNRSFRTIANRLIVTFAMITILAAMTTILIGGLSNFYRDRTLNFERLRTIAQLRETQINTLLQSLSRDASAATQDSLIRERAKYLLQGDRTSLLYRLNQQLVEDYFRSLQTRTTQYDELLLLDAAGRVIISTDFDNRQRDLSTYTFFQNAFKGTYITVEQNFPEADGPSIILVSTIVDGQVFPGIVALRVSIDSLGQIGQATEGFGTGTDSYLIGPDGNTLTDTIQGMQLVTTQPYQDTFIEGNLSGEGIYDNYNGESVLGYYKYIPSLNATVTAEVQQSIIIAGILNLLATYGAVGLFTTAIAITLVYTSSRSIGIPIVELAEKASILAAGDLSTRIQIKRADEIGTLATTFNSVAEELQVLVRTLEERVDERTRALQKQATRLRLAAEVSRDATTADNLDELLTRTAGLLLERFGYYHTGIFLIDRDSEQAVLRASTTEAGKEMLKRGHSLKIGQVGIVGQAAATGEARIALDTGQDVAFFNNPLLPLTRSEMAIPLKVERQVIGILDVQSEESDAFSQEDIDIIQVVADQLALAIERVELLQNLQRNISELQRTYQTFTENSWLSFTRSGIETLGYKYDGLRLSEIDSLPKEAQPVLRAGNTANISTGEDIRQGKTSVAVPVKLREVAIGALLVKLNTPTLSSEIIATLEAIAARLAVAMENSRLLFESRERAERERAIAEVASQISTADDADSIMKIALQELGKRLSDSEISIRLNNRN